MTSIRFGVVRIQDKPLVTFTFIIKSELYGTFEEQSQSNPWSVNGQTESQCRRRNITSFQACKERGCGLEFTCFIDKS